MPTLDSRSRTLSPAASTSETGMDLIALLARTERFIGASFVVEPRFTQ
jgi:hypothetical protein